MEYLQQILSSMSSISLEEMNTVKLMNRTDTKYLLNKSSLYQIARRWSEGFFVQEVEGNRIANYKTLYFDTDDSLMYTVHHNRKLNRQKVRQRVYLDNHLFFCEVKTKNNHGRTKKKRIAITEKEWGSLEHSEELAFLKERLWITDKPLHPCLQNQFQRITLVNKAKTERITVDSQITFHNMRNGCLSDISDLVIVEVKQDGNKPSAFKQLLYDAGVHEKRISKYCLGMLLTDDTIKYNRFKDKIRYIGRLIGQELTIKATLKN